MGIRRRIVARDNEGHTLEVITGDALPWRYDRKEDAFHVISKDGQVRYAVGRSRPTGTDSKGHKLYRYWVARALMGDAKVDLGNEYMVASEGIEVCELYESARHEGRTIGERSGDNTRRVSQRQNQKRLTGS